MSDARRERSGLAVLGAYLVFVPVIGLLWLSQGSIVRAPWSVALLLLSPFAVAHVLFLVGMLLAHFALFRSRRAGKRGRTLALATVLAGYAIIVAVVASFRTTDLL